jgi:uncharacterized RDD family membrane protein YckC
MPRELIIRTPENVEIAHSLAGIGSRFIAALIDHVFQLVLILAAFFAVTYGFQGSEGWQRILDETINITGWALAVMITTIFLIFWGYFIVFEVLWNGQTPGKRAVQIRVVKDNGQPVDFFSSAVRNVIRILDFQPGVTYAVGVVSMFFSPSYKRVGDYAAGTVVVKEYVEAKPGRPRRAPKKKDSERTPEPVETTGVIASEEDSYVPGVSIEAIRQVTRDEYDAARRFMDRRADLNPTLADDLARRIAEPILSRLNMTPDAPERYPYSLFLETLAHDYIRQQDMRF